MTNPAQSLVLLTYKGKILLRLQESDPTLIGNNRITAKSNVWSFIGATISKNKTIKESIVEKVKRSTSIQLTNINYVKGITQDKNIHYFHAELSDNNINNIVRKDGEVMQFFTLNEIDGLTLSMPSREFVDNFGAEIANL